MSAYDIQVYLMAMQQQNAQMMSLTQQLQLNQQMQQSRQQPTYYVPPPVLAPSKPTRMQCMNNGPVTNCNMY
ncbi:hypothetical protein CEK29_07135 [Bordetella genomosp. 5]|uniref:hypothetical protein n=1 Tax=Bordetella genomosp. 5 TaxID=1395608 RepID=UPI000B9E2696|nr:hypothetical protein [Bordetella genomosp. 5]OZI44497.1 hypothetical protein CEK29_07135 [Bordetella genomosp. 5]